MKAEETEGAKEGLGVRGTWCVRCGHDVTIVGWDAHVQTVEHAIVTRHQPTDAPPSTPDRAPNPIPDQVLTPLSALLKALSPLDSFWESVASTSKFLRVPYAPNERINLPDLTFAQCEAIRAALAGVPKEAPNAE